MKVCVRITYQKECLYYFDFCGKDLMGMCRYITLNILPVPADLEMNTQNIALVQCVCAPHGNSLKEEGYICTMPSVLTSFKNLSGESTAKRNLSFATSDVSSAPSASSLPRGRQQVNDMRRAWFVKIS